VGGVTDQPYPLFSGDEIPAGYVPDHATRDKPTAAEEIAALDLIDLIAGAAKHPQRPRIVHESRPWHVEHRLRHRKCEWCGFAQMDADHAPASGMWHYCRRDGETVLASWEACG
jgi:hypothetical protein